MPASGMVGPASAVTPAVMRFPTLFGLLVLPFTVAAAAPALAAPPPEPDWEQTLEQVARAVVALRVRGVRDFDTERARGSTGTGFVVDMENGLLLTNRHMVHTGPVIAEAVLLDHEEIELEPIYRDPVHDFGFYRFDPGAVKYMDLVELPLAPEHARVGTEIRVVGNDSGEKISILDGTLARLDRAAPYYGGNEYNDFNTFYLQAASNTSGGSSGSPVVDRSGRVIGLNAGSRTSTASAFYLPLDRIVRALPYIQRGEVPPRGTLQTTFLYTPYDEVRRLGLREETEAAARAAFPDATGMLVVDQLVPGGPGSEGLEPGDVIVKLDGEPVGTFVALEAVLDEHVGGTVTLELERGGESVTTELEVGDLHAITPDTFLEASRGIFHPLSYMQARNHNLPIAGVYVAQSGYAFQNGGVPERTVITALDGEATPDLETFQAALESKAHGARVRVRYYKVSDPRREIEAVVRMDRAWHAMQRCSRDAATGDWPCVESPPAPEPSSAEPATVAFPAKGSKAARALASSLVKVDVEIPYPTAGVKSSNYLGVGLVVDAERGLVLTDRDTVPVRLADIFLTFGGQARVPARVRYLHPVHNLAVLEYDPALLGTSEVTAISLLDTPVETGDRVWQVGIDGAGNLVDYETTVARTYSMSLGASRTPRFRDVNVEGFGLTDSLSSIGGVIADKKGRVVAGWLSFMDQARGEAHFRALPSTFMERVVEPLRRDAAVDYRALGVDLGEVTLADARDRGLPEERAAALLEHAPDHRRILEVERVWGGTPAASVLRNGDLLVEVDGATVSRMREIEALTRRESVSLVVLRDGKEVALDVATVALDGEGIDRLVQWAGLIVHAPHHEVAAQSGTVREGIYGSWIWYGTPAFDAEVRPTRHIVEIDGEPITDLDSFLAVVGDDADRQPVRVKVEALDGRVQVQTMKEDLRFWPTEEIRWDGQRWVRLRVQDTEVSSP